MKKIIFLSLCYLLTTTFCWAESTNSALVLAKTRDKLIIGVKYDTNLFGLKDPKDGQVKGFDVDLARAITQQILGSPKKLEFKPVTANTRIPSLQNSEVDMVIATMTITEERKKLVDFSDIYFEVGQSLLVAKDSSITGLADLKGKSVIVMKNSTSAKNIRQLAPEAQVLEYDNYTEAFKALQAKVGEVLSTDNSILLGMQRENPNFKLVGGVFTYEPYGIAVRKGDHLMLAALNQALKNLRTSGKYQEIYQLWFGEIVEEEYDKFYQQQFGELLKK
jgi:putative glutamine transport system substrate-binding protein